LCRPGTRRWSTSDVPARDVPARYVRNRILLLCFLREGEYPPDVLVVITVAPSGPARTAGQRCHIAPVGETFDSALARREDPPP
jgi:hypothetical protein